MPTISSMSTAHLDAVLQIQIQCYPPDMQEDAEQIAARLQTSPEQCWVAQDSQGVCGYLFGYLSQRGRITPLNGAFEPHPQPDCLYLHDLAIVPRAAGLGVGAQLAATARALARARGLAWSALISVQDSAAFWLRQGYRQVELRDVTQHQHLLSYPSAALYMEQALDASNMGK